MDITKTQFAKLVLGYLKIEKCQIAYKTFLSTSPYLKDYVNPTKRRHLVTRILGLSLHDILEEFSKIYTIIQEHLEDTNYFNESNQSHLLHDQLIYLLEVDVPTRRSTPQSSTSLEFIPNASEDELFSSSPPKKQIAEGERKCDLDKTAEDNATQLSIQAITDTLLKHPEFQEKIAENINKVRLSDGALDTPEKLQNDIDSAIKAVLEKTQNDPMFETLMGEIIGTAADEELIFNNEIQSKPTEEPPPPPQLLPTEPQQPEAENSKETIDDHIKVAVDSIVTASQQVNSSPCADNRNRTATDVTKRLAVNTNNDIIFYDGTIDNYMQQQQQNNMNPSPTVPPLVLNNLLVVASSTPAHQVSSVNATKPFYLLSGSPYVNVAPTQPYFVSNKVLTEKDILSMPTVILNDDKSKSADPKPKPKPSTKKKSEDALTEYLSFNNDKVEPKAVLHVEVLQEKENVEDKTTKEQQHLPNTIEQKAAKLPISDTAKRTPESKGGGGCSGRRSGVSTPRSTSKSHVRALDFKFQTPSKEVVEVRKSSPKVSTAKSLFSSSTKSRTPKKKESGVTKSGGGRSWDADLRATLPDMSHNLKKRKKQPPVRSKPKANLNKTEEDAKQIENNLHFEENLKEVQQSAKMNGSSVELEQQVTLRKHEEEAAVTEAAVKKSKEDEQVNERELLQTAKTEEEKQQPRGTRSRKQKCAGKANVTVQLIESENRVHEIALRNFNAKPRFHRKCNIENNTKFKHIPDKEMVFIGAADVVAPEATAVPHPLVIASSPSIVDLDSNSLPVLSIPDTSSFATPEGLKSLTAEARPISAGRNIMPILETPYKEGICPKTPGRTPMITVETPFTKVFNEQMEGVDISSIQTPQLTPFPITPLIHGDTPYSNRPTDYSTSSSYYQPSDTEQNKSLEMQIIEECKRLENKKTPMHQSEGDKPPQAPPTPARSEMQESLPKQQNEAHKVIADKMKSLSSNVIGRKNLSMVPKNIRKTQADEDDNEEEDEDDSDESSSCDSDSSSCSSSSSGETYVNRTIVEVQDETRYSLRSARQQNNEEIKNILSQVSVKNELVNTVKNNYVSVQQLVLRELDEKRRRTIAIFKNENTPSAETRIRKQPKTNTDTTIPVQNFNSTPKRVLRSTVKSKAKKEEVVVDLEPMQMVETEMLCSNSSDYCDGEENGKDYTEAEKLVTGLRERGIHLMKVASPKVDGGEAVSNKNEQQAACSPDMNNSNEENKINTQNVQKSSNSKKEMYSFLFGPDDSKDGESEKSKTPLTTSTDDGIKQRPRLNRVVENRRKSDTKDGVKKNDSKTDKKTHAGKKGSAKDETIIKTTNRVQKESKSPKKKKRNSKSIKSSNSCSQQNDVSKLSKSEEKSDAIATKVLEHVDELENLKKSVEDKAMERTKMSEVKRIESTNQKTLQQISKTEKEGEYVTISHGVVYNSDGAKEEIDNVEKSKKKIINDDVASKSVDSITKDATMRSNDVIVHQTVINDPYVDEFDRSLVYNENFEFRYVESDPPNFPEVHLPLDKDEDMVIEVMLENGSFLPITLQKVTIHDFWHVDPKPAPKSQMLSKKRKRNLVEVLGDISVTPIKKVATKRMAEEKKNMVMEEIKQTTVEEEPPKKKFSKHHKIEDVVADLERPQELLKEVDVDNFLDKLHGA